MMRWTDELDDRLRILWATGRSASESARELGLGLSRCAVIGRVHRLGLTNAARQTHPSRVNNRFKNPKAAPVKPPPEPVTEFTGPLNDFPERGKCRFPRGSMHKDFQCCGHDTGHVTEPWCSFHRQIVFNTAETRRVNARALGMAA